VIYHADFAPMLAQVRDVLPEDVVLIQVADDSGNALLPGAVDFEAALAQGAPELPVAVNPDDLHIIYTGGTTGMPKAVLWRQHDIFLTAMGGQLPGSWEPVQSYEELVQRAVDTPPMRLMLLPPLMHGAAQWGAFTQIHLGGTLLLPDTTERLDAADVLGVAERERATAMQIIGDAMARPLIEELERKSYDLSPLFLVGSGSVALTTSMKQRLHRLLPNVLITDGIGSSETGPQATYVSTDDSAATGTFTAGPGARVASEDLIALLQPGADTIGWLAQTGNIPLGYFGDPKKTARTFPVIDGVRYAGQPVSGTDRRTDAPGRDQRTDRRLLAAGRDRACDAAPAAARVRQQPGRRGQRPGRDRHPDGSRVDEFVAGLPAPRPGPAPRGRRPGSQPPRAGRDRPVSAAEAVQVEATVGGAHVFADTRIDRHVAAIAALIDPGILTEAGWDPARKVLAFAPEHPLLGRPVCRAADCSTTAPAGSRICGSCRRRLAAHGLGEHEIASLPPRGRERSGARTGRLPCRRLRAGMGVGAVGIVLGSYRAVARVARRQSRPVPYPSRKTASAAGLLCGHRLHPATTPPRRTLPRGTPAAAADRLHTRSSLRRILLAGNRAGDRARRGGQSARSAAAGGRRTAGGPAAALPRQSLVSD
jgi:hypothetical protein